MKIHRLKSSVINQIAAGEVVENPASIIKELVENSLDAGAERILVEIHLGGHHWIKVEDDGCGMGREDAVLCLERHATSKLKDFDDLQTLKTMGFRGEALAAIAAVSHFQLKTATEEEGTRVMAEGGILSAVEPCARNRGTTIEVRSLFYNVPARKKFQKSSASSTAQIIRQIETAALAYPNVAFTLISQGAKVIETRPENRKQRVEEILGKQDLEIHFERNGMKLWGFVAPPQKAALNRTGQYFFINQRPIFSPLFAKAVKEGFGTRIAETMYPPFVLFLEISPDAVDINIHPQKKEARFRNDSEIFKFVNEAVASTFEIPQIHKSVQFEWPKAPFSFAEESLPIPAIEEEVSLPISFPERAIAVWGGYLLLEKEGWKLVDLIAAEARVIFDSLAKEKGEVQSLILPIEIDCREEEIVEKLAEMGIESRILGKKLVIDTLPTTMNVEDFPRFFDAWMAGEKLDQSVVSFCRNRKKVFHFDEAYCLWKKLQTCSDSLYDPMGNLIWKEIGAADLERWMNG